jgi:AraC-like DNA-binding protein
MSSTKDQLQLNSEQLIQSVWPGFDRMNSEHGRDITNAVATFIALRHKPLNISAIAGSLHMSRRTLERRFLDQLGVPVRRAMVLMRLEIARLFLIHTELSVTVISNEAGFSSRTQMANVFRRELNRSPKNVRLQSLADTGSGPTTVRTGDLEVKGRQSSQRTLQADIDETTDEWLTANGESYVIDVTQFAVSDHRR